MIYRSYRSDMENLPLFVGLLYISDGARFLPSTVLWIHLISRLAPGNTAWKPASLFPYSLYICGGRPSVSIGGGLHSHRFQSLN